MSPVCLHVRTGIAYRYAIPVRSTCVHFVYTCAHVCAYMYAIPVYNTCCNYVYTCAPVRKCKHRFIGIQVGLSPAPWGDCTHGYPIGTPGCYCISIGITTPCGSKNLRNSRGNFCKGVQVNNLRQNSAEF